MPNEYLHELQSFSQVVSAINPNLSEQQIEFIFERIYYRNLSENWFSDILEWYEEEKTKCDMTVSQIPLADCRQWSIDGDSGSLVHDSGEFFRVDGIRVGSSKTREVEGGWDQPILTQVGYDGGILGLIRKRIDHIPHYLVEAKAEPGNYKIVQISTTVQATFSNLKRAHKGNNTPFAEYFLTPEIMNATVIYDQWMSEDGGRLFNKRNRSMIAELDENTEIPLPNDRYKWLTSYQLVHLISNTNAIVAPHIRGILSGV